MMNITFNLNKTDQMMSSKMNLKMSPDISPKM